jgi:hypothetical protein
MRPEQLFNRLSSIGQKPSESDRADSFELAVSARRFSRRTQAVVEDKLSFSATLMRAGEVEAANRLLAEVGEEVLSEEVALLERMNEVKVARSMQPDTMTRGRLARTLAVAMLGASLFAFSAAGAAVAGLFRDSDRAIHGADPGSADATKVALQADRVLGTRQVRVLGNVSLPMTAAQFRKYTKLTSGSIDEKELELFLLQLLPAGLAEKVQYALITGLDVLPEPVREDIVAVVDRLPQPRQQDSPSADASQPAAERSEEPKTDPTPEPSPEPSESPSDEETPKPEESPEDANGLPLLDDDEEEGGE